MNDAVTTEAVLILFGAPENVGENSVDKIHKTPNKIPAIILFHLCGILLSGVCLKRIKRITDRTVGKNPKRIIRKTEMVFTILIIMKMHIVVMKQYYQILIYYNDSVIDNNLLVMFILQSIIDNYQFSTCRINLAGIGENDAKAY